MTERKYEVYFMHYDEGAQTASFRSMDNDVGFDLTYYEWERAGLPRTVVLSTKNLFGPVNIDNELDGDGYPETTDLYGSGVGYDYTTEDIVLRRSDRHG